MRTIGIIGGGAWGTTLGLVARRRDHAVLLWAHEAELVAAINARHANALYLPDIALDPGLRATGDLAAVAQSDLIVLATPAQHLRGVLGRVAPAWRKGTPAVIAVKGIEDRTAALMSEVVVAALPQAPIAILSGPTFAIEVARDLPTAVTVAATDTTLAATVADVLGSPRFRTYQSEDPIGAQIGGAVKNVLAIACGIVEGRGLGDNARAALITRGLAEMIRLGIAKGARPETFMGLSGLGDLTLTCNALQSRNFSLGFELGQGRALKDVLGARRSVAEGVATAAAVSTLAKRLGVDMPIALAVDGIVNHFAGIDATIAGLLARPVKLEMPTVSA